MHIELIKQIINKINQVYNSNYNSIDVLPDKFTHININSINDILKIIDIFFYYNENMIIYILWFNSIYNYLKNCIDELKIFLINESCIKDSTYLWKIDKFELYTNVYGYFYPLYEYIMVIDYIDLKYINKELKIIYDYIIYWKNI